MGKADYPKCKTCRHWNDTWGYVAVGISHGQCRHPNVGRPQTYGHGTAIITNVEQNVPDNTGLYVSNDFGCVLHEDKIE